MLGAAALERMLRGLSCRRYGHGLESVGQSVEPVSTSKRAVDRRFIAQTGDSGAILAPVEQKEISSTDARRDRVSSWSLWPWG